MCRVFFVDSMPFVRLCLSRKHLENKLSTAIFLESSIFYFESTSNVYIIYRETHRENSFVVIKATSRASRIRWFMNIGYRLRGDRHCESLMHHPPPSPRSRVPSPPPLSWLTTSNVFPGGFYFAPLPPYRNEPALTSSGSIKLPILHFSRPFVNPRRRACIFYTEGRCPPYARSYLLNSRRRALCLTRNNVRACTFYRKWSTIAPESSRTGARCSSKFSILRERL